MSETLTGCGGCGLFLHHTPECRWKDGWKAVYFRYGSEIEDSFDTYEEALAFLGAGEGYGNLSSSHIVGPDGTVVVSRESHGWQHEWPEHAP